MNPAKVRDEDYIQFLIATPKVCSATEAGRGYSLTRFIGLALRAFLRLEWHCYQTGLCWFEAKLAIVRPAIHAYLANPLYILSSTA